MPIAPVARDEEASPFTPPVGLVRVPTPAKRPRRRYRWGKLVAGAVLVLGLGAVLWAMRQWLPELIEDDKAATGKVFKFPQLNCQLVQPGPSWQEDTGPALRDLKAELVLRWTDSSAGLALLAKDYKDHTPSDSEAREEVIRRLGGYFNKEGLGWEQAADTMLAGQRAQRLLFQGEVNNKPTSGECAILAHQGLLYGFVTWAAAIEAEGLQAEFAALRKQLTLVRDRKDWKEKRPPPQVFRGSELPYSLQDLESRWQKWTPASAYDPQAILALVARDRPASGEPEERERMIAATVLVLLLKQRSTSLPAAVKAARAHLEAQQKILYPQTTIEVLSEKPKAGEADRVGSAHGQLLAIHVVNAEKRHRYVLLGVVPQPEQILVLQCECAWDKRASWQPEFAQLLGTFRIDAEATAEAQGGGAAGP
jgi:hypothetical protein